MAGQDAVPIYTGWPEYGCTAEQSVEVVFYSALVVCVCVCVCMYMCLCMCLSLYMSWILCFLR